MTVQLEYASWYARSGMAVLPLHRPVRHDGGVRCSCGRCVCAAAAKHPFGRLVPNGLRDASKDPTVIAGWFGRARLNVGIATGAVSGIVVLDIDPRHDGDRTLAALEREHGPLPPTWRFRTGGGGEHILFRHPGRPLPNSAGTLGPGVDVRGDGGYIVAPPSEHLSGRPYAFSIDHHPDAVSLADLPPWLPPRLRPQPGNGTPAARPAPDWRAIAGGVAVEGERNRTLASLTGHLLRHRVDPWVALNLLQAWNRTRCRPPLPDAEVTATVRSIARCEIARREGRHAR